MERETHPWHNRRLPAYVDCIRNRVFPCLPLTLKLTSCLRCQDVACCACFTSNHPGLVGAKQSWLCGVLRKEHRILRRMVQQYRWWAILVYFMAEKLVNFAVFFGDDVFFAADVLRKVYT